MSKPSTDTQPVPQDEKEAEAKEDEAKEEDKVEEMQPIQQLWYFCKRGDAEGIKSISSRIDDINACDDQGTKHQPYKSYNTALHYAVLSGSLETVEVIYNLEAKLDSTNKLKCTPLHLAASLGYVQIVDYLIRMKANIEAKNVIQNTPLHCAVYAGHVDTVKVILDNVDDIRQSLMLPVNGVGFGAVKYTSHDDMRQYLRQFFPKKAEANEKPQFEATQDGQNDVEEEERAPDIDDDNIDETTGLTATEQ
eukprot:130278_1